VNWITTASRRDHLRHLSQTALAFLGVALGVALVLGLDLAIDSAEAAFESSASTLDGRSQSRIVGGPRGVADEVYRSLRVDRGFEGLAPIIERSIRLGSGTEVTLVGVDPYAEIDVRGFTRVAASSLDDFLGKSGGALCSRELAAELGVKLGESFPFTAGLIRGQATLAGFIEPAEGAPAEVIRQVLVMDLAGAQEQLDNLGFVDRIDIAPDIDEAALIAALPPGHILQSAAERGRGLGRMRRAFRANLGFLGLLALVVAAFLVHNTATISVLRRRRQFALMRAHGVPPRRLARLIMGEGIVLGLLGSLIGLGLGYLLGKSLTSAVTTAISDHFFVTRVSAVSVQASSVLKALLLGLGATILAMIGPAREIASLPASALGRDMPETPVAPLSSRPRMIGFAIFALLGLLLLTWPGRALWPVQAAVVAFVLASVFLVPIVVSGVSGLMSLPLRALSGGLGLVAARAPMRHLRRTGIATAALAVALAMTLGIAGMIASFRDTVSTWLDDVVSGDVYVGVAGQGRSRDREPTLNRALVAQIRSLKGVDAVATTTRLRVNSDLGAVRLFAFRLAPGRAFFAIRGNRKEALARYAQGELLASEPFVRHRGLEVGDLISLTTESGPRDFRIGGIFRDFASDEGYLTLDRRHFDQHWTHPDVSGIAVYRQPDTSAEALADSIRRLAGESPGLTITTRRRLLDTSLAVFDRTFAVTQVLRWLALIVAFVGIVGSLAAVALERKRELAVMRARGLSRRDVMMVVLVETAVLGLAAGLLGAALGTLLAWILCAEVNPRAFGWSLPFSVSPRLVVETLGLGLLAAVIAGLWPALRMGRRPLAPALRSE
jgi:putative ABC transport system permease protein